MHATRARADNLVTRVPQRAHWTSARRASSATPKLVGVSRVPMNTIASARLSDHFQRQRNVLRAKLSCVHHRPLRIAHAALAHRANSRIAVKLSWIVSSVPRGNSKRRLVQACAQSVTVASTKTSPMRRNACSAVVAGIRTRSARVRVKSAGRAAAALPRRAARVPSKVSVCRARQDGTSTLRPKLVRFVPAANTQRRTTPRTARCARRASYS